MSEISVEIVDAVELNAEASAGVHWDNVTGKPSVYPPQYPSGGEVGYVLKKTSGGAEWSAGSGSGVDENAVHYTAESKTAEQKAQARSNIGAEAVIADIATIRSGAALGATALQAVPDTYRTAAAQDVIDAGKAAAVHGHAQSDVTGLVDALAGKQATIADLADIRSGASAGATAYQKPASGIPSTDMAQAVVTSLGKADTALQEHQSLAAYRTAAQQDAIHDSTKQDVVSDLHAIRSGAALGATALQPESGKGLYPDADATKLAGIEAGADVTDAANVAAAGAQMVSNLVTSVSEQSTDAQYPSAKLLYDTVGTVEAALNAIRGVSV